MTMEIAVTLVAIAIIAKGIQLYIKIKKYLDSVADEIIKELDRIDNKP